MRVRLRVLTLVCLLASSMAAARTVPGSERGPPLPGTPQWFCLLAGLGPQVLECWDAGSLSPTARAITIHVNVRFSSNGKPENIELYASDGGSEPLANGQAFKAAQRAILGCGTEGYDLSPVEWRPNMFAVLRFEASKSRLGVSYWGYE